MPCRFSTHLFNVWFLCVRPCSLWRNEHECVRVLCVCVCCGFFFSVIINFLMRSISTSHYFPHWLTRLTNVTFLHAVGVLAVPYLLTCFSLSSPLLISPHLLLYLPIISSLLLPLLPSTRSSPARPPKPSHSLSLALPALALNLFCFSALAVYLAI